MVENSRVVCIIILQTSAVLSITVLQYGFFSFCSVQYCSFFRSGAVSVNAHDYFSEGLGLNLVSNVNCSGTETEILDCAHITATRADTCDTAGVVCQGMLYNNYYNKRIITLISLCSLFCLIILFYITIHDVYALYMYMYTIVCLSSPPLFYADPSTEMANCSTGEVRLVGSGDGDEGRLEVCVNNAWGTVCSDGFDSSDAAVACEALGGFDGSGQSLYVYCNFFSQYMLLY